ncbi:extracellular solute-binding protein [Flexivirga sp. ID2601S]|uniref:Extracellular solute-binding protein n=1 Tax=Flexivirga aerilata TaxID=1656889 RepID=A0A849ALJ6_9MICO|nr:extracellular solute-binding protein [Flexivirga aerilata]NNG40396.1 extracellular solute-binding protein [Flexivirga aerilata]
MSAARTTRRLRAGLAAVAAVASLGACSGVRGDSGAVTPPGEVKAHPVTWLLSRPADGATITVMKQIAADYAKNHPGFELNLITTPDRPSYIQKFETLAAANKLPEFFDTDATPFAQKLASQGRMLDVSKLLRSYGIYDDYRPIALNYQRFDDGRLYTIPFEYQAEYFFYNKALFAKAGVTVPRTLNDLPATCTALRKAGITPIALDGQDQWPLERYAAYPAFRAAGPSYITKLKYDDASLADPPGQATVTWLAALGKAGCFQSGFSATGYADAQNLFTSGKAAIYNIGTWELPSLATSKLDPKVRQDVDFFTLPNNPGSPTADNEFVAPSGIGMAVNSLTFDPLVRDFLQLALTRYPSLYAATGALSPTTNVTTTIPKDATPLYRKALDQAARVGPQLVMPWDTQLDPTSNTRLQQDLVLLVQGDQSAGSFTQKIDRTIAQNAPKKPGK